MFRWRGYSTAPRLAESRGSCGTSHTPSRTKCSQRWLQTLGKPVEKSRPNTEVNKGYSRCTVFPSLSPSLSVWVEKRVLLWSVQQLQKKPFIRAAMATDSTLKAGVYSAVKHTLACLDHQFIERMNGSDWNVLHAVILSISYKTKSVLCQLINCP